MRNVVSIVPRDWGSRNGSCMLLPHPASKQVGRQANTMWTRQFAETLSGHLGGPSQTTHGISCSPSSAG